MVNKYISYNVYYTYQIIERKPASSFYCMISTDNQWLVSYLTNPYLLINVNRLIYLFLWHVQFNPLI